MAVVTRYVNTASSGGNGTTNATSGTNAAYASLSAWNAAEATDLVTANDSHVVICTGGADSSTVNLSGWTTNATYTLTVRCDDALDDTLNTSQYHIAISGTGAVFSGEPAHLEVKNIRSRFTGNGTMSFFSVASGSNTYADGIWFDASAASTYANVRGIYPPAATSGYVRLRNSIFRGPGPGVYNTTSAWFDNWRSPTGLFENCVITNFYRGINKEGGTVTLKNCAIFNNTDDISGTVTASYCATDDGDGTNAIDISPGGTESTDWAAAFTDYANGDFTVKDTSSVLYHAGVAISGLTTDIVGETWNDPPSVGAFEYVSAGAGPLEPNPATSAATTQNPTIAATATLTAGEVASAATVPNPVLDTDAGQSVAPDPAVAAATAQNTSLSATAAVTAGEAASDATVQNPSLSAGATVSVDPATATATVQGVSVRADGYVSPNVALSVPGVPEIAVSPEAWIVPGLSGSDSSIAPPTLVQQGDQAIVAGVAASGATVPAVSVAGRPIARRRGSYGPDEIRQIRKILGLDGKKLEEARREAETAQAIIEGDQWEKAEEYKAVLVEKKKHARKPDPVPGLQIDPTDYGAYVTGLDLLIKALDRYIEKRSPKARKRRNKIKAITYALTMLDL